MPGGTSTEATTSADGGGSTCGAATERCWRCFFSRPLARTTHRPGSHLDVPRVLTGYGESGRFFGDVVGKLPASTFDRPRVRATGQAGDVYLCHPFLVHRATWPHRGVRPRILAQPAIGLHPPFALHDGVDVSLVERAILDGLGVPALRL